MKYRQQVSLKQKKHFAFVLPDTTSTPASERCRYRRFHIYRHNPWQPSHGYDSLAITFVNIRLPVVDLVTQSVVSVAVQRNGVGNRVGRFQRNTRFNAREMLTDALISPWTRYFLQ